MRPSFKADLKAALDGVDVFCDQGGKVVAKPKTGGIPGFPLALNEIPKDKKFHVVDFFENAAVWSTIKGKNRAFQSKGSCSPRL